MGFTKACRLWALQRFAGWHFGMDWLVWLVPHHSCCQFAIRIGEGRLQMCIRVVGSDLKPWESLTLWLCVCVCVCVCVCSVGGRSCESHKSEPMGSFQGAGPSSPGWATCLPSCLLPSSLSVGQGQGLLVLLGSGRAACSQVELAGHSPRMGSRWEAAAAGAQASPRPA